jgi:hypothetical protein
VADHRGGRQDRPLRPRRHRPVLRRPQRARSSDSQRGALLGRRRHRHVDHGHLACRRRDLRPGNRRADRRMDSALLRDARRHQGRRVLRVGAERRLGRLGRAHDREVRRGHERVGAQRPEGVGDQRRHLRRPRRDRDRRPRARLARARRVRRADERGEGHLAGDEGQKAWAAGLAHRRRLPRRLSRSRGLRAWRQGQARRAPGAGARGQESQVSGGDADVRGLAPDRRCAGDRRRARGLRVCARVREGARAVRPQNHRKPVDRLHARAHEARDRRRPPARVARVVDGAQRRTVRGGRGLDVQAQGRRGRRVGDRARDPDSRRERLHARVPRRALAPRREDLRHLRGHRRDPAARDLAALRPL